MSHYHLTATQDFGSYKRGAHIEDAAEVERILASEHRMHVVKVAADRKPAPAPVAAAEAKPALIDPAIREKL